MDAINVLGISGSLRAKSYNSALLRAACKLAPAGMTIEIASIRDIPQYDGDVEDRASRRRSSRFARSSNAPTRCWW